LTERYLEQWNILVPRAWAYPADAQVLAEAVMRTREEHLTWCTQRALEYVDAGELVNAVMSMGSDLRHHPETTMPEPAATLLLLGGMYAERGDAAAVRRWIEGFN
jgi:hypothetical protein